MNTPRTNKAFTQLKGETNYLWENRIKCEMRQLERELNAANAEIKRLKAACDAYSEEEILNPRRESKPLTTNDRMHMQQNCITQYSVKNTLRNPVEIQGAS